jgi:hypothetical protein
LDPRYLLDPMVDVPRAGTVMKREGKRSSSRR